MPAIVVKKPPHPIILGNDFYIELKTIIDLKSKKIIIDGRPVITEDLEEEIP